MTSGVRSAHVTDGSSGGQGPEAEAEDRGGARRLLATQGQLGQRHGLMREALRGQHGKGMTWRSKANSQHRPE